MISPGASMISPFDASISMKAETEFESGAAAATGAAARNAPEGGAAVATGAYGLKIVVEGGSTAAPVACEGGSIAARGAAAADASEDGANGAPAAFEGGAAATPVASHDAAGACDWIVFEGGVVSESDESEDGELVAGEGGTSAASTAVVGGCLAMFI